MPIEFPVSPKAFQDAFLQQIYYFLKPGDPSLTDFIKFPFGQLEVRALPFSDLIDATMIPNLKPKAVAWRYYLRNCACTTAFASVMQDGQGTCRVSALSRGSEAAAALRAVASLSLFPDVLNGHYTTHIISIPGILTEALWLNQPNADTISQGDLFLPYLTPELMGSNRVYPASEFIGNIVSIALRRRRYAMSLADARKKRSAENKSRTDEYLKQQFARRKESFDQAQEFLQGIKLP
jgi:hypothetical protein